MDNKLSDQIIWKQDGNHYKSSSGEDFSDGWSRTISGRLSQQSDSVTSKLVKFLDNTAIMLTKDGESMSLDARAGALGNPLHDILANLLKRKKPVVETKETKISFLAKEVGFQLLSDDFEVQITETIPSNSDDSQPSYIDNTATAIVESQISKLPVASSEHDVVSNTISLDRKDITPLNDQQSGQTDTDACLEGNQESVPYSESNVNDSITTLPKVSGDEICSTSGIQGTKDHESNAGEDLQSFACPANVQQESPALEKHIEEQNTDQIDCGTTRSSVSEQILTDVTPWQDVLVNDADEAAKSIWPSMLDEWHVQQLPFKGSFFFFDGEYQLLRSLTGETKIPSLVVLDPVLEQHYVYSEETYISYPSLVNFLKKYLNGSLTPYRRSESIFTSSRESPQPPFVNLDFHETDSIPRVTANMFCEVIIGYKPCKMGNDLPLSEVQNFRSAWKMDVLVLFSTSWCGFCQRMELVVREVYRALKNFRSMSMSESRNWDTMHTQGNYLFMLIINLSCPAIFWWNLLIIYFLLFYVGSLELTKFVTNFLLLSKY